MIYLFVAPIVNGEGPLRSYFLFFALVYGIPFFALTGAAVGAAIKGLNLRFRTALGLLSRTVVGIFFAALIGAVYSLINDANHAADSTVSQYLFTLAEYGVLVGALAGVAAGK